MPQGPSKSFTSVVHLLSLVSMLLKSPSLCGAEVPEWVRASRVQSPPAQIVLTPDFKLGLVFESPEGGEV